MRLAITLSLGLLACPAAADVTARFIEGAPKDRFQFVSQSACLDGPVTLTVDLSGSAAGLIFDVTGAGQGVEVFQPFELDAGGDFVLSHDKVADGDQSLSLTLKSMPNQTEIGFTIDLDDTLGGREITVNGSEIVGAQVKLTSDTQTVTGTFDAAGRAVISLADCTS